MFSIEQTTWSDSSEILRFLESCNFIHRHLDWLPLLDWIDSSPFLKYKVNGQMEGIFVSPPDPPGVAWIKSFACRKQLESYQIFKSLLEQALNLLPIGTLQLLAIGLQDWFIKLLTMNDFRLIQKVVVLKHKQVFSKSLINPSVFIRPMQLDDITAVAEVDQTSFEPIWTVSSQGLKAAFFQSARASVAEMGGKIIGYELSTANSFSAHLARIAVLPEFQKEKIGFQLVHAMIEFFYKMGIRDITVNTQDSNHASISLYQKAGFQMTGDQIPVFQYKPTLNTGQ